MSIRKTKIVCTMGPNTDNRELMFALCNSNMDVARFNFSHGDYDEQRARFQLLCECREKCGRPVPALLDTKGPEIRTGLLEDHQKVSLETGHEITLTTEECVGTKDKVFINYNGLNEDVNPGDHILIDDGLIDLEVKAVDEKNIVCTIISGGELGERKGVNVPGVSIKLPALTEKDIADIKFGIHEGFDFIAASFVRNADCIYQIRELLKEGGSPMQIIAKIENQEGIDNLDSIIEAADGIMVARGDLGVEVEPQKLPHLQKEIIRKCNEAGKIVITATQMLDSMIRNPRPTRAEVADVANAVYDGTDAVMLSGETAMGKYPLEALSMMAHIAEESEQYIDYSSFRTRKVSQKLSHNISNAVCYSAVATASELDASAIVAPTVSGFTARMLSKYRPSEIVLATSPNTATVRRMMILWGVRPVAAKRSDSTDELVSTSIDSLKDKGLLKKDDLVIMTAGVFSYAQRHEPATDTNIMRVVRVD
jgi:pyruvate kinase